MEAEARLDFGALTHEEMMDVMTDRRNMNESISLVLNSCYLLRTVISYLKYSNS